MDAEHEPAGGSVRVPRRRDDAGFGLIEVLVAMTLFAFLALAVLTLLLATQRTTYGNRSRVAAANLAASEFDAIRAAGAQGVSGLPIGVATPAKEVTVGTTRYSVTSRIDYVAAPDQGSACAQASGQQPWSFVKVNVTVVWPSMGAVRPVTTDGIITPTYADTQAAKGAVVAKVADRAGHPVSGVTIALTPSLAAVTSVEGCAIFTQIPPASYTVKASRPGYVSQDGGATPSTLATVSPATTTSLSFTLDEAATVVLTDPPSFGAYPLPQLTSGPFPMTLVNPDAPGGALQKARTPVETTFSSLFPFPGGYSAFAGDCTAPGASGQVLTVGPDPGQTVRPQAWYGKVDIAVTRTAPSVQFRLGLSSRAGGGCTARTWAMPSTTSATTVSPVKISLPPGTYDIVVSYDDAGTWRSVSSDPSSPLVVDAGPSTLPAQTYAMSTP